MKYLLKALSAAFILSCASHASAAESFQMSVMKCSDATNGCGSNLPTTHPLQAGSFVSVTNTGDVLVFLKGAAPLTKYTVFVGNWDANLWLQSFSGSLSACGSQAIGTITTDGSGGFAGQIKTATGSKFRFPLGTSVGQPNFAFNEPGCATQFTTGFKI
jgi:hypothetical protein